MPILFFFLLDSLFGCDYKDSEVTSVEECFEVQCNQVFVGMVTMQYQAQIDMVCHQIYPKFHATH